MMPFSTETGLERVGIAGPKLELPLGWSTGSGRWTPMKKQERKRIDGGSLVAAPMPKSVLSCEREYQLLRGRMFCVPFTNGGGMVFIVYVFPNWRVTRILSHWMRDFLSLSLSD